LKLHLPIYKASISREFNSTVHIEKMQLTTWSFENPWKRFGLLPAAGFPNRAPKAVVLFDT